MSQGAILYEQPISELMRVALRLEYLFQRFDEGLADNSTQDTQFTMQTLIEIIRVLDRPDLKSKLGQEIHRYLAIFRKLENTDHVDQDTLHKKITALQKQLDYLSETSGKLGQNLSLNEFLTTIRLNLNTAGNGCCMDMPAYRYWLHLPSADQLKQFKRWREDLAPIENIINTFILIVRGSGESKSVIAEKGFYHENLPTNPACQLITIEIPDSLKLFPEISAGKHRFTVRFLEANFERSLQTQKSIEFKLTSCAV